LHWFRWRNLRHRHKLHLQQQVRAPLLRRRQIRLRRRSSPLLQTFRQGSLRRQGNLQRLDNPEQQYSPWRQAQ
jgi:hypothetical protein